MADQGLPGTANHMTEDVEYVADNNSGIGSHTTRGATGGQKRVLVRWNDDIDKQLLLTIQWACTDAGIKLPYERIAAMMGPVFSAGAIQQHLAKLRNQMEKFHIPVPPPLRRGVVAKSPSAVYGSNPKPKGDVPFVLNEHELPKGQAHRYASLTEPSLTTLKIKAKPKGKGRRIKQEDDEDDDDVKTSMPELYDSDDEYGVPQKKKRGIKKVLKEQKLAIPESNDCNEDHGAPAKKKQRTVKVKKEPVPDVPDSKIESSIVTDRTRGTRKDYAEMQNGVSDEEYDEPIEVRESNQLQSGMNLNIGGSARGVVPQNLNDRIIEQPYAFENVPSAFEQANAVAQLQYSHHQMPLPPINTQPVFADVHWNNDTLPGNAYTGIGMDMSLGYTNFNMMPPVTPYQQIPPNNLFITPRTSVSSRKDSTLTVASTIQTPITSQVTNTPITPVTPGNNLVNGFGQLGVNSSPSAYAGDNFELVESVEDIAAPQNVWQIENGFLDDVHRHVDFEAGFPSSNEFDNFDNFDDFNDFGAFLNL